MTRNIFSTFFEKITGRKASGAFSDFLMNAPKEKKIAIFKEAAQKANEDQQKIFKEYHNLTSKITP